MCVGCDGMGSVYLKAKGGGGGAVHKWFLFSSGLIYLAQMDFSGTLSHRAHAKHNAQETADRPPVAMIMFCLRRPSEYAIMTYTGNVLG